MTRFEKLNIFIGGGLSRGLLTQNDASTLMLALNAYAPRCLSCDFGVPPSEAKAVTDFRDGNVLYTPDHLMDPPSASAVRKSGIDMELRAKGINIRKSLPTIAELAASLKAQAKADREKPETLYKRLVRLIRASEALSPVQIETLVRSVTRQAYGANSVHMNTPAPPTYSGSIRAVPWVYDASLWRELYCEYRSHEAD